MVASLINLGLLYWKRHSHPVNLVLLTSFTLIEASTIGVVVAFVNNQIVLQALLITLGVFLGLTLFTLQSKVLFELKSVFCNSFLDQWDFSGMAPFLFGGLIALGMSLLYCYRFVGSLFGHCSYDRRCSNVPPVL
jgi:FtsH-binding integral membrane protein